MASFEYKSKQELMETIHALYLLFAGEFDDVKPEDKDVRITEVDRTPAEMIAYQLGWMHLVMGWDEDECKGKEVSMPAPGYKWNQLGGMYQSFYDQYANLSLPELLLQFQQLEQRWQQWIDTFSEEELFTQGHRKWTGSKANWPVARWIHINSAAPFKTFRAKIRKWKKHRYSL
ncbi:ClbS/DfsB family four-helix bundle protein [Paenibacillus sanguinis]|uniref:ClbS/DfsB family four-helix bundle protein n=1 Tax=Paenibacillus sanguinis TaxID=225906 RepID=UPI0003671662|nr:ClbS/DfsB family four-helix bundle protein [Paenibacillus sanguinis]